jgi:hypothetical protein
VSRPLRQDCGRRFLYGLEHVSAAFLRDQGGGLQRYEGVPDDDGPLRKNSHQVEQRHHCEDHPSHHRKRFSSMSDYPKARPGVCNAIIKCPGIRRRHAPRDQIEARRSTLGAVSFVGGLASATGERRRFSYLVTTATGTRGALTCRTPVSTKPIMAKAPTSMQIVINRLLGSLIFGERRGPPIDRTDEPPATKKEKVLFFSRSPVRPQASPSGGR